MADLKDFGVVKSWYEAYKQVNEKEEPQVKVLPKDDDEEKEKKPEPKATDDADSLKAENEKLKAEIEKLKLDISKKDAETNVEPNADTGEVPLRVGIAQSILDKKKKKEVKEETLNEKNFLFMYKDASDKIFGDKAQGKLIMAKDKSTATQMFKKSKPKAKVLGVEVLNKLYGYEEVQKESLDEKLKVSDGLGAWISDFQKSDAPQFKGKSDKERRDMAIAAFTDAGGKLEQKESLDESPVVDYARKLSSYAVKKGGIDRKDFMKIADRISTAKNDMDMKKIGKLVDDMDTEPRDLIKGSIALQMGPKTYKTMFGDRLTSRDMNQYKKMTPRDMREETLDELKEPFIVVDTAQGNKVVGMASDEKEAQSIISSAERPPMRIKNKKTLKIVKVRKKQMIGRPLKEETLDEVNANAVGTITSKQMNALKKSYNSLPDRIDPEKAMALSKMLNRFGEGELRQLTHAGIKFISTLAINKLIMKHKYKAKDIHDIRKNKPKTVFD